MRPDRIERRLARPPRANEQDNGRFGEGLDRPPVNEASEQTIILNRDPAMRSRISGN